MDITEPKNTTIERLARATGGGGAARVEGEIIRRKLAGLTEKGSQ